MTGISRKLYIPASPTVHKETFQQRETFSVYYACDCSLTKTHKALVERADKAEAAGKPRPWVPAPGTLKDWRDRFYWKQRAAKNNEVLDQVASRRDVDRKNRIMARHAELGMVMTEKAIKHFKKMDPKKARTADMVAAARVGVEIERKANDMPEWAEQIPKMTEEELLRAYEQFQAARYNGPKSIAGPASGDGAEGVIDADWTEDPDGGGDPAQ